MGYSRVFNGVFALVPAAIRAVRVTAPAGAVLYIGNGCDALTPLIRPRHHHWSTYRGGPSGGSRTPSLGTATSSSLPPQPSSALFARKGLPINRGSTATNALPRQKRRTLPKIATASGNNSLAPQAARNAAGITNASASEKSAEGTRPSTLRKSSSTTARVTVRRAKKRDYQGVADIRGVIIPVGMSGATGFLGGKVMIDDPVEAERRKLMAKVADLVSGEAVALIALEGRRIVGTVDCILQPLAAPDPPQQPQQQADNRGRGGTPPTKQAMQVFLKNLFVLPEERRRGIARELVKGAELFARKEKSGMVCLDVAPNNVAARQLYSSCGFEEVPRPGPVEGGIGGAFLKSLGMGKKYMVKIV